MSYLSILASEKKCATCAYWKGSREPSRFVGGKMHSIKADSGDFPCIARNSQSMKGGATCPKWKKWDAV